MNHHLRKLCLPLVILTAVGLSACGGSAKKATASAKTTTATTSAASSSTPAPAPGPTLLTKSEFVAKMNAVCVDYTIKIQQLPRPTDETDYAHLAEALKGTLRLFPSYIKQAEALVSRSADKTTLTDNWLSVEKSDFAASEPVFTRFIADVKAKNHARFAADTSALERSPDHSEAIAGFMSGYGLKSCAILERS